MSFINGNAAQRGVLNESIMQDEVYKNNQSNGWREAQSRNIALMRYLNEKEQTKQNAEYLEFLKWKEGRQGGNR